ncbi:MAG: TIGR04282 family arsenosugar biosynthesis glycosyltransferase [Bacteroidota bacterium]
MSELLIVFCKNPIVGKVKTRLAQGIGPEKALNVYVKLLEHTLKVASLTRKDYAVYYADYVNNDDLWNGAVYKELQNGLDIGERMNNAIADGLSRGYDSVVLIGTDIYDLSAEIVNDGFAKLFDNEIVIGPAKDGGYYLIGMKKPYSKLFQLKVWSSSHVFEHTLQKVKFLGLTCGLLEKLNDIDCYDDLKNTNLI